MPAGASPKRERQYQHIKESYEKRGQKGRAEEIAARTVNKERVEAGETKKGRSRASSRPQASSGKASQRGSSRRQSSAAASGKPQARRSSSASGKPQARGSSSGSSKPQARGSRGGGGRTRAELYERARRQGVSGRSKMNKAQLQRAVAR